MKLFTLKNLALAVCASSAVLLAACHDDDNNSSSNTPATPSSKETVSGTAATGKALATANVEVTNKNGAKATGTTDANGKFSVSIDAAAPYMVKVNKGDTVLYSYAAAKGDVNVTQLTTQALFSANGQAKLDTLYSEWAKVYANITQAKINEAAARVAANLNAQFKLAGYSDADAKKVNIFTDTFTAATATQAGTGLDKVLDKVQVAYDCNVSSCNVRYTVDGKAFEWNYNISTSGYSVVVNTNGNGPAGSGQNCVLSVDYSVKVSGFEQKATQKTCYVNFPQNTACSSSNSVLANFASNISIPGAAGTVTIGNVKYESVTSCPSDAQSISYVQ